MLQSRRAVDAIISMKGQEYPATREYFELFTKELENFRFEEKCDPISDNVKTNFESFVPYRDECLEVVRNISRYTKDVRFSDLLHAFFERFAIYFEPPDGIGSHYDYSFDNFKFFAHELFLHCGALLIAEERYDLFNTLIEKNYYIERKADFGHEPIVEFTEFRQHLRLLEFRNNRLNLNRLSVHADMLKERTASSGADFKKIMQVDFILFLRAELAEYDQYNRWWPETLVYLGFVRRGFELFERSRSARYFERIRPLLGNARKEDLERLVKGYDENPNLLPKWGREQIAPAILVGIQNLCTRCVSENSCVIAGILSLHFILEASFYT